MLLLRNLTHPEDGIIFFLCLATIIFFKKKDRIYSGKDIKKLHVTDKGLYFTSLSDVTFGVLYEYIKNIEVSISTMNETHAEIIITWSHNSGGQDIFTTHDYDGLKNILNDIGKIEL